MFGHNPLMDALKAISSNQQIQAFLRNHRLNDNYVNRYLWYTILNHDDEAACKQYLKLLIDMVAKGMLDPDTLTQLLLSPRGEDRNIGEMIAEKFSKIDCILLLTDLLEGLPPEQYIPFLPCNYDFFRNPHTKEELHNKAESMLEPQACIDYCLRALDRDSPLGYLLYLQRGCYPCEITAGILGEFLETLMTAIEAHKMLQETVHIVNEVIDEITKRVNESREKKSHHGLFTSRVDSMLQLLRDDDEKDEKKSIFDNVKFSFR